MQVTPQPVSDYNVLKAYLLFLVGTTENLEIQHIFRFCDKAVCSKLLHIIRNNRDEFKKVIPIMGRFHQLLCLQKVMYKCYACLVLETWITDARTTKPVSAAEKTVQVFIIIQQLPQTRRYLMRSYICKMKTSKTIIIALMKF